MKKTTLIVFNKVKYYLDRTSGYMINKKHNKRLHREIWKDYNKKDIPDNMCIHHKDGDKLNNNIDNLDIMTISDHSRHHSQDDSSFGKCRGLRKHNKDLSLKKKMNEYLRYGYEYNTTF